MVRQKSPKKQRKSLAGDGRDADVVAKFAIEECAACPADRKCTATSVGIGNNTKGFKDGKIFYGGFYILPSAHLSTYFGQRFVSIY